MFSGLLDVRELPLRCVEGVFLALASRHLWRMVVLGGATWGSSWVRWYRRAAHLGLGFGWRSEFGVLVVPFYCPSE